MRGLTQPSPPVARGSTSASGAGLQAWPLGSGPRASASSPLAAGPKRRWSRRSSWQLGQRRPAGRASSRCAPCKCSCSLSAARADEQRLISSTSSRQRVKPPSRNRSRSRSEPRRSSSSQMGGRTRRGGSYASSSGLPAFVVSTSTTWQACHGSCVAPWPFTDRELAARLTEGVELGTPLAEHAVTVTPLRSRRRAAIRPPPGLRLVAGRLLRGNAQGEVDAIVGRVRAPKLWAATWECTPGPRSRAAIPSNGPGRCTAVPARRSFAT